MLWRLGRWLVLWRDGCRRSGPLRRLHREEELAALPDAANLGSLCGNPTAMAQFRQGETVADLGSGYAFDCFIAGRKVGPRGL